MSRQRSALSAKQGGRYAIFIPFLFLTVGCASSGTRLDIATTASPESGTKKSPSHITASAPAPSAVSSSASTQPPIVAPLFALPDLNQPRSAMWQSQEALGQSSIIILLLPDSSALPAKSALPANRSNQPNSTPDDSGSNDALTVLSQALLQLPTAKLLIVGIQCSTLEKMKARSSPKAVASLPNLYLLWDGKKGLRDAFGLQKRFNIAPGQAALIAIDRAGWLRRVEKVASIEQAAALIKQIGDPTPKLEEGKPAPDFALRGMNGVLRRPSDLKGKKHLLLTFFPKCFTGNCSKQLESLRDAKSQLQANDVEVWAVSVDPAEGSQGQLAFAKHLDLWFPLLPDVGRSLSILYRAANSPNQMSARMSVLIDKHGMVRWIDKQINPSTHGTDVVAKMRELGLAK